MKNLALFISGSATTACAIIDACKNGPLKGYIHPALVIASHDNVPGIENVYNHGISMKDITVIDSRSPELDSPEKFGEKILAECRAHSVYLIGQYGWMEKTPSNVVAAFRGRSINQHPCPLDPGFPDFGGPGVHGLRAHFMRLCFVRQVGRDYFTEATAHRVEDEFDKGAVLYRHVEPILPTDTAESLQKRLLPHEHQVQICALKNFALGRTLELSRRERLVLPSEEGILADCLKYARLAYPYKR